MVKNYFFDMDGVLADFMADDDYLNKMMEKDFFLNLEPMDLVNIINTMNNDNVFIVSACVLTDFCKAEKLAWLSHYLPNLKTENIILCDVGENKAKIIMEKLGRNIERTDVLFDDYSMNISQWEKSGGTAVKVLNGYNNRTGKEYNITVVSLPMAI